MLRSGPVFLESFSQPTLRNTIAAWDANCYADHKMIMMPILRPFKCALGVPAFSPWVRETLLESFLSQVVSDVTPGKDTRNHSLILIPNPTHNCSSDQVRASVTRDKYRHIEAERSTKSAEPCFVLFRSWVQQQNETSTRKNQWQRACHKDQTVSPMKQVFSVRGLMLEGCREFAHNLFFQLLKICGTTVVSFQHILSSIPIAQNFLAKWQNEDHNARREEFQCTCKWYKKNKMTHFRRNLVSQAMWQDMTGSGMIWSWSSM